MKITDEEAIEIYNSNESSNDLAKKFSISVGNVNLIRAGKRWSRVTQNQGIPIGRQSTLEERLDSYRDALNRLDNKINCNLLVAGLLIGLSIVLSIVL